MALHETTSKSIKVRPTDIVISLDVLILVFSPTYERAHSIIGQGDRVSRSDTILHITGIESPVLDDVGVGDQVIVVGTWEDAAAFRAMGIGVSNKRKAGQQGIVRGCAIRILCRQVDAERARLPAWPINDFLSR